MKFRSSMLSALGALLLASCGNSGAYYEKSPNQVASALKLATLPTHILGSTVARSRVTQPNDQTVVTALLDSDGNELMQFVTTVVPEGEGSRVSTELKVPEGKQSSQAQGYAMDLMGKLADEHVAAAIEGRPFDMMFATGPIAKGALAHMPGVNNRIQQANEAAATFAKMDQKQRFREEYGDDWGESGTNYDDGWADSGSEFSESNADDWGSAD